MLKESFLIRPMQSSTDLLRIINRFSFPWHAPEKTQANWETYHQEQEEGVRTVFVIENQNEILSYGSPLRKSENPTFTRSNIPEVNAIWIDETCPRQGLAQRLYFRLGYIPDKSGIIYKGLSTKPGQFYLLDDDLLLWLVKPLTPRKS